MKKKTYLILLLSITILFSLFVVYIQKQNEKKILNVYKEHYVSSISNCIYCYEQYRENKDVSNYNNFLMSLGEVQRSILFYSDYGKTIRGWEYLCRPFILNNLNEEELGIADEIFDLLSKNPFDYENVRNKILEFRNFYEHK